MGAQDRQRPQLQKSVHGKAKKDLHAISEAPNRAEAEAALDRFVDKYGAKYDKAATCLTKDRTELLAFYDFPAEQWKHLSSGNPIESTFATVRLRTDKTKGCLSRETALAMVFKARQVGGNQLAPPRRRHPLRSADRGRPLPRRRGRHQPRGASRRLTPYIRIAHRPRARSTKGTSPTIPIDS
jgi:hypothetical protein